MKISEILLVFGSFLAGLSLVTSVSDNSHIHGMKGPTFSYKSTDKWPRDFPTCGGRRQSPINIQIQNTEAKKYPPFRLIGYDRTPRSMNATNDGHTVEVTATWPNNNVPVIEGGPLKSPYEFEEVHFHWGPNNNVGSEHTINGRRFSLEMHVVHFRKSYGTFDEALKHADGIAVLGYLLSVSPNNGNEGIKRLLRSVAPANEFGPKRSKSIRPFPLTLFNLDSSREGFYTYSGSLTTPPCTESVIWLVAKSIKKISSHEMSLIRQFPLDSGDKYNYRPIQPLNGRPVFSFREL